jgi:opacity protein-like surface antigen
MSFRSAAVLAATIAAVLAAPAAAGAAEANPYSAQQVCGAGYSVPVASHAMWGRGGPQNRNAYLADVVLLYNPSNGTNCAVTLKRLRVGKPDHITVAMTKRGWPYWRSVTDGGEGKLFSFYAGPVYVHAPHTCVKFGANASPDPWPANTRLGYYENWSSGWVGCR